MKKTNKEITKILFILFINLIIILGFGINSFATMQRLNLDINKPIDNIDNEIQNNLDNLERKIKLKTEEVEKRGTQIEEDFNRNINSNNILDRSNLIEDEKLYDKYSQLNPFGTETTHQLLEDMGIKFAIDPYGELFISKTLEKELNDMANEFNKVINNPIFKTIVTGFISFITTVVVINLILALIQLIAKWLMYKKANKPGWALLLPVYKDVILLEMADLSPALLLIYLIGFIPFIGTFTVVIASFVIKIIAAINISRAFDKSGAFALGLIFLPTIFYSILGFGKSEYNIERIKTKKENKKNKKEEKEEKEEDKLIEAEIKDINKGTKSKKSENKETTKTTKNINKNDTKTNK